MSEETPLQTARIYRGPQVGPLLFYVPMPVLIAEVFIFMAAFKILAFWALSLLPIHLIPVIYTRVNPNWLRDLKADIRYRWFAPNKHIFGKGVVTYSPLAIRRKR